MLRQGKKKPKKVLLADVEALTFTRGHLTTRCAYVNIRFKSLRGPLVAGRWPLRLFKEPDTYHRGEPSFTSVRYDHLIFAAAVLSCSRTLVTALRESTHILGLCGLL